MALTSQGSPIDFRRAFLDAPADKYEVEYGGTESVGGTDAHVVVLRPKARAAFVQATVWIESARLLIRRVEIREENGSVRTIALDNIEVDPVVPEGTFTFTPPPGVRVITP